MKNGEQKKCIGEVTYVENGRFTDFWLTIKNGNEEIKFQFNPFQTNKKALAKFVYKLKCFIDEAK